MNNWIGVRKFKWQYIILLCLLIMVIYTIGSGWMQKNELLESGILTDATLISYYYPGKGENIIYYEYKVDDVLYEEEIVGYNVLDCNTASGLDSPHKRVAPNCLGYIFTIKYLPSNPEVSMIYDKDVIPSVKNYNGKPQWNYW